MEDLKICTIKHTFFNEKEHLTEINQKINRVYLALEISVDDNKYYIPFESKLYSHPALTNKSQIIFPYTSFENGTKQKFSSAGINFEKCLIINDLSYIVFGGHIPRKQYQDIQSKKKFIIRAFTKYISDYKAHVLSGSEEMPFRYKYSTLKYFHEELNIT